MLSIIKERLALGIQAPYEAFYVHAMLFSTRSAMSSIESVTTMLSDISEGRRGEKGSETDMDQILNQLQNVIAQGAALSRYFWPVRKEHDARGSQLRKAIEVTDDSALKVRSLRDAIEHFDERLDIYLCADSVAGVVMPQYVGNSIEAGPIPNHFFRAYFVDTGVFQLLDENYEIPPIADEISRVHESLKTSLQSGGRLPQSRVS